MGVGAKGPGRFNSSRGWSTPRGRNRDRWVGTEAAVEPAQRDGSKRLVFEAWENGPFCGCRFRVVLHRSAASTRTSCPWMGDAPSSNDCEANPRQSSGGRSARRCGWVRPSGEPQHSSLTGTSARLGATLQRRTVRCRMTGEVTYGSKRAGFGEVPQIPPTHLALQTPRTRGSTARRNSGAAAGPGSETSTGSVGGVGACGVLWAVRAGARGVLPRGSSATRSFGST